MRYRLSADWAVIQDRFRTMFLGLGDTIVTEDLLSFSSIEPSVVTGVALSAAGDVVASMPLHSIESRCDFVEFHEAPLSLTLYGPHLNYTYTVPSAIVSSRTSD